MAIASTVLLVRPAAFGYNSETATNNHFQNVPDQPQDIIARKAIKEFDQVIDVLNDNGIKTLIIEDTASPPKPDAIFPNNWLSTSPEGKVIMYPMFARNRRAEKRGDIVDMLIEQFVVTSHQDWSEYEVNGQFLEGTGSMVIDHDSRMIYACISSRTHLHLLEKFARANNYSAIPFTAKDRNGYPVYHTNVVMALGEGFCVLCEQAIVDEAERIAIRQLLTGAEHVIIPISIEQMSRFAGNLLQLKNEAGKKFIIISESAVAIMDQAQLDQLAEFGKLLQVSIPTIEHIEGGSIRCMLAEIFLEAKK